MNARQVIRALLEPYRPRLNRVLNARKITFMETLRMIRPRPNCRPCRGSGFLGVRVDEICGCILNQKLIETLKMHPKPDCVLCNGTGVDDQRGCFCFCTVIDVPKGVEFVFDGSKSDQTMGMNSPSQQALNSENQTILEANQVDKCYLIDSKLGSIEAERLVIWVDSGLSDDRAAE